MRLLNVHNLTFKTVDQTQDPTTGTQVPYVVISHRWLDNELTFQDMEDVAGFHKRSEDPSWAKSQSAAKLKGACNQVYVWSLARYGSEEHADFVHHVWLDTVCIDKKDPAELSEAINSMYRWYERATVCFVYVYDYQLGGKSLFSSCSWWERGWTLQELVAPVSSEFYDRNWTYFGNKIALSQEITNRTRISGNILSHMGNRKIVSDESIGRRMSWYADRKTAKGEDAAYCLMGLFRVNMPLLYGEGSKRAFRRLQEEILKYSDDHTLFAWVDVSAADDGKNPSSDGYGLLAPNPACFRTTGTFEQKETPGVDGDDRYSSEPYSLTNRGLSISLRMFQKEANVYVASLDCRVDRDHHVGIFLKRVSERKKLYARIRPQELCKVHYRHQGELQRIFVREPMNF